MILDALRPIRFENGSGYYFINRLDGVKILSAANPQQEGSNLLNRKDAQGQFVIQDMINIAKESGEGFYEYRWTKPESAGNDYKKISFVKRFEPHDWIIGTGLYVDDVESQIKADLLSTISRIRFGREGYIFINKLNGDALISNGKVFSGTEKLWEIFGVDPEKAKNVFKKEYQASLAPEGDYIYYTWMKLTTSAIESPKTSFIYGIPELQWLVGAGVYLDDEETNIASMQAELIARIKSKLIDFILITIGISGVFFLFFSFLNLRLRKDIAMFISFFNSAANSDREIDREHIKFIELDQMAEYANRMIADRKQMEESLRVSEEKYRNLFNNAEVGIYRSKLDGSEIIEVNRRFLDIVGMTLEDTIGKPSVNLWADLKEREEMVKRVIADGSVSDFEITMLNKLQGDIRYCLSSLRLYREQEILEGSILDITERKQAEETLRLSEFRLNEAQQLAHVGSFYYDFTADSIWWSDETYRIFRLDPGSRPLSFDDMRAMIHPDDMEYWESATQRAMDGGHGVVNEYRIIFSDGTVRHHYVLSYAKVGADGHPLEINGTVQDVTERKLAEKENAELESRLLQAQRIEAIGSLAAGIAHDLNNILFPISGLSEMLLDDIPSDSPAHEHIEQIHRSTQRATDLVKQVLAFSRQSTPRRLPIRIQPILKEALNLIRASIPMHIEISSDIEPDCGMVSADPTQIHQIAMNLITNAYHAVEETGGTINIELKETEFKPDGLPDNPITAPKYVVLTVSDTGTGIDKTLINKIFDPYFTTKEHGKGTGLGLSVVYGIVREYCGDIQVFSEIGKGTTFHVYLPLLEGFMDSKTSDASRNYPAASESILLVDDEEPIAQMMQLILERLGYQVTTRTDSLDALSIFRDNPMKFNLVISDRGMPNMTGDQLAEELLSIRPEIPIILCTGFCTENEEKRAHAIGVRGLLMKPVTTADLAKMVRKVLYDFNDFTQGDLL